MTPGLPPEAAAHYRRYVEDDRFDRHWIERVRTQQVLARVLPEPAVVLDVGGGTGVHARSTTWSRPRTARGHSPKRTGFCGPAACSSPAP